MPSAPFGLNLGVLPQKSRLRHPTQPQPRNVKIRWRIPSKPRRPTAFCRGSQPFVKVFLNSSTFFLAIPCHVQRNVLRCHSNERRRRLPLISCPESLLYFCEHVHKISSIEEEIQGTTDSPTFPSGLPKIQRKKRPHLPSAFRRQQTRPSKTATNFYIRIIRLAIFLFSPFENTFQSRHLLPISKFPTFPASALQRAPRSASDSEGASAHPPSRNS